MDPARKSKLKAALRRTLRWLCWLSAGSGLALLLAGLVWFRHALYHRWVQFPAEVASLAALRAGRQPVAETTGWQEYRGILHSHSRLSHDCEVPFEHILQVMKDTGRDFICLSDHCDQGRADFSRPWRGLHDGKLFIPGYEMKEGLMPFGVASGVVLSNQASARVLARQITAHGGVLFFAHPEEPRDWEIPELAGMEIYNIHADFKDQRLSLGQFLPDVLLNLGRYPDQVARLIFDPPTANLQRWDRLNLTRHITGIAGNDCHQNTGLRGIHTPAGTVRIEDTSPATKAEYQLNFLTRWLARICFGPLEPGRTLFQVQLDPYERMTRFVATHVLARELTEPAILEALRVGRAFVAFDLLAESAGFVWMWQSGQDRAVMGEERPFVPDSKLVVAAPQVCLFTIFEDCGPKLTQIGRRLEYSPPRAGAYRVEARLLINSQWVPWIYSNPIWLH